MSGCAGCRGDWRLEILDLATGERVAWLPYTSFSIGSVLNDVGQGQVTAPLDRLRSSDIFPRTRSIAFTRINGQGASSSFPVCEWIGYIDGARPTAAGNSVSLGLVEIQGWLAGDIIPAGTYADAQTTLGADAVTAAGSGSGIPLSGVDHGSATSRTIIVEAASDTPTRTYVEQLVNLEDGPDYVMQHVGVPGAWASEAHFYDEAGNPEPRRMNAVRGLTDYGLTMDGALQANRIVGRDQDLTASVADGTAGSIYPRWELGVKFSDTVNNGTNLAERTDGELQNRQDVTVLPDITIADLGLATAINLGDAVYLDMDNGAIRFLGNTRTVGKAWSSTVDGPTLCTMDFVPTDPIQQAVLNAPPRRTRGCC